jgi:hypothetical protein
MEKENIKQEVINQIKEIENFVKTINISDVIKRCSAISKFTFQKRNEDKNFLYWSKSNIDNVKWGVYCSPISNQKNFKSFFNPNENNFFHVVYAEIICSIDKTEFIFKEVIKETKESKRIENIFYYSILN